MKYIIILLAGFTLVSCSSISTETYTERRVLTYPKKTTPHIKEMYMQEPRVAPQAVIPQVSVPQSATYEEPLPVNNDYVYVNPDMPAEVHPDSITLGSTKADVGRVMGTPTKVTKHTETEFWWYKSSYIVFNSHGEVEGWSQNGTPLKLAIN